MSYTTKKLEGPEIEIKFTIEPKDYEPSLKRAAERLSQTSSIKGFRPGAAPYDIIKQQMGEQKILEAALEEIVQKNLFKAIQEEKIETVGMPVITVEKAAPGNEVAFTAKVALMPKIKLADLSKIKVGPKKIDITEKEMGAVLNDLRKMRTKEALKSGPATKEDKIVVDMDMFLDKVPVEGGQAKDHQVYLSEEHYIPGFADQLIGLKKDEEKEFTLKFPKEHYQKHMAGRDIDIKVKTKDVFSLELPELNDDFAKGLGQKDLETLKKLLTENLTKEAEQKEAQRIEAEILEQLIEKSEFDEIPEVLVAAEKKKMFHELKHDLEHRGIEMEKYLADIKKTEDEIYRDFDEGAKKRVKAALVARQVASDNEITASKDEVDKELEMIRAAYGGDATVEENLKRPEVLDTITRTVQNRKVVEYLKSKIVS